MKVTSHRMTTYATRQGIYKSIYIYSNKRNNNYMKGLRRRTGIADIDITAKNVG